MDRLIANSLLCWKFGRHHLDGCGPSNQRTVEMSTRSAMPGFAPRALAGIMLLLQLVLAAGIPLADGRLDRDGPIGAHFEQEDGAPCPAGHDHLKCQFCRYSGSFGDAVVVASIALNASPEVRLASNPADRSLASSQFYKAHPPRAPPSA